MVILTMLVERLYISWEEDGWRHTLRRLAGTLVVGALCYLVLAWERLGHLLRAYPESHCFTELWRFHDLVRAS